MSWSEFSFILMPSKIGGIGVFATTDIEKGVFVSDPQFAARTLKKEKIPAIFHKYCIHKNNEEFFCPPRFDCMQIGWFINHSDESNVVIVRNRYKSSENIDTDPEIMSLITCKKIFSGDEILVNYNNLNEPVHLKEDYYKQL